jgi:CheY-like chemotaxis protein
MDSQLPALDGYDATQQIKALTWFAAIPIIAVSSIAMGMRKRRGPPAATM